MGTHWRVTGRMFKPNFKNCAPRHAKVAINLASEEGHFHLGSGRRG